MNRENASSLNNHCAVPSATLLVDGRFIVREGALAISSA